MSGLPRTDRRSATRLDFQVVDAEHWNGFRRLFEAPGSPKSCWCMVWRATAGRAMPAEGASRRKAMAARIKAGTPVGLLGYLGSEPVAWCSVAPRSTYRRLVSDATSDQGIWSIVCFFVVRRLRGTGATKQLLAPAQQYARKKRARVLEAYPVDADSPSYRFMGFVPLFEEAGFREIGRTGKRRHVMRRNLYDFGD